MFRTRITGLAVEDGRVKIVVDSDGRQLPADAVIIATGGMSYRNRQHRRWYIAAQAGHTIVKPLPALVPMETVEGLARNNSRPESAECGAYTVMAVARWGRNSARCSSRTLASADRCAQPQPCSVQISQGIGDACGRTIHISIDLKPALDEATLIRRIQRDLVASSKKQLKTPWGCSCQNPLFQW